MSDRRRCMTNKGYLSNIFLEKKQNKNLMKQIIQGSIASGCVQELCLERSSPNHGSMAAPKHLEEKLAGETIKWQWKASRSYLWHQYSMQKDKSTDHDRNCRHYNTISSHLKSTMDSKTWSEITYNETSFTIGYFM